MHFDATQSSSVLRSSLCGFVGVATTTDASLASCRLCLARLRGASRKAITRSLREAASLAELAAELHLELENPLTHAPCASPPPRLTCTTWATSCKGGEHRRCGECDLCLWERDAELWYAVSPWNRTPSEPVADDSKARFRSVVQALVALVEHENRRMVPSALGRQLVRLAEGVHAAPARGGRRIDPQLVRDADDLVHVARAVDHAYGAGAEGLEADDCKQVLLARLVGVQGEAVPWVKLIERYAVPEAALRRVVRHGRRMVEGELVERGLLRVSLHRRPPAPATTVMQSPADLQGLAS
ncbi:MAG TPA: hypothetical protein VFX59_25845 [Polyangiales bacterium]|nr:hypothetical protein [Polyangiales bacterium]